MNSVVPRFILLSGQKQGRSVLLRFLWTRGKVILDVSELNVALRAQLVMRLLSKEEPAAQIARRAGISEQTLYRWREEFIQGGKQALSSGAAEAVQAKEKARLEAQLADRDQVIGELTIANRF